MRNGTLGGEDLGLYRQRFLEVNLLAETTIHAVSLFDHPKGWSDT